MVCKFAAADVRRTACSSSSRATVGSLGLLICLLTASLGCQSQRPNIVFVLIDTLRADRVGAVNAASDLTPFLDELAASGVAFRHAYAQSSWTLPSVASLMTSRYQSQHGLVTFKSVLSEDEETLAEVLHRAGYRTLGLSANVFVSAGKGLGQGFDVLNSRAQSSGPKFKAPFERAAALNRRAKKVLATVDRRTPLFLYLHYMEPHPPAAPSMAMLDVIRGPMERPDLETLNKQWFFDLLETPADLARYEMAYDAEVM